MPPVLSIRGREYSTDLAPIRTVVVSWPFANAQVLGGVNGRYVLEQCTGRNALISSRLLPCTVLIYATVALRPTVRDNPEFRAVLS